MAPTLIQIATWGENDCPQYNRTVTAWKAMQKHQPADFNSLRAKNHLDELSVAPTNLTDASCTFESASN